MTINIIQSDFAIQIFSTSHFGLLANTRPSSHRALWFFIRRDGVEGAGIPSHKVLYKTNI